MAAPSGPGTHIREVIAAFENAGHTVVKLIAGGETLLNTGSSIQFKKRAYRKFIPDFVWHTLKDFKLKQFDKHMQQQLVALIELEKPDVVYERAYYLMASGYKAAKQCGVKYVCEINAPYPQEKAHMEGKSAFSTAAVKNEMEQVQSAYKVIVVSSALKKYLQESASCDANKIVVTPNAVNPELIKIEEDVAQHVQAQLKISPQDKVIGFVGSIFPYHGVDILLRAFINLKQAGHENLKLLIVGDGEILGELKALAHNSRFANEILFTGNVPHADVYTYINAMDITVMARSNWYGSPVKIFEYGALQKLVIAPNEVPVHDVMTHGKNGLIMEPNESELEKNLLFALQHSAEAQTMAQAFYTKVMAEHTWQHVGNTILNSMQ
jgi:glycosyltransferase involved in cell wall biosynthesis